MSNIKRVSVFDLNGDDCTNIVLSIRLYFEEHGIPVTISQFTKMQPFAYDFDNCQKSGSPYHMVFIGVDNMLGVETARNIRGLNERCPMFLLSNTGDYGMEGFRLHALDYITKPLSPERVKEALSRIDRAHKEKRRDYNGGFY